VPARAAEPVTGSSLANLGPSVSRAVAVLKKQGVKASQVAEIAFLAVAATAVYKFVRVGVDAEERRVCSTLCALGPDYAGRNRRAPDFDLPALSGGRVRLSNYRGQVVILNFWTKTCAPCLEEMASLAELGRTLRGRRDVVLLTVSTDANFDDVRTTLQAALGGDPPFAVLLDPEADVVAGKFGTKLFPETWYIDGAGVIRARVDGARDWSQPLSLQFAESLRDRMTCDLSFRQGRATGPDASRCEARLGGVGDEPPRG
jgi:peroxiredoxin